MTSPRLPSRDAVERLAELTARYRSAFEEVQDCLANAEMGRIPAWVFAVDRLKMDDIAALSLELAAAESKRRSLRVALHALVEFIALEDTDSDGIGNATANVDELITSMGAEEDDHARQLDRFISVVNYAKSGGCIYINGTFEPVVRRPEATPSPARDRQRGPISTPVPKGDDIALPDPDAHIGTTTEGG